MFAELLSGKVDFAVSGEAGCSCGPGAKAFQIMTPCNGPGNSA